MVDACARHLQTQNRAKAPFLHDHDKACPLIEKPLDMSSLSLIWTGTLIEKPPYYEPRRKN